MNYAGVAVEVFLKDVTQAEVSVPQEENQLPVQYIYPFHCVHCGGGVRRVALAPWIGFQQPEI
jgi:hypothetical protein